MQHGPGLRVNQARAPDRLARGVDVLALGAEELLRCRLATHLGDLLAHRGHDRVGDLAQRGGAGLGAAEPVEVDTGTPAAAAAYFNEQRDNVTRQVRSLGLSLKS